jgi:putative transposase
VRHNVTDYQSKNHGLVSGEALNVQNMMASASGTAENPGKNVAQKAGLNRVIGQQGFGETFRQFEYKCLWNGGLFLQVPAAGSSQRCFKCKHEVPENRLTQAVFRCVKCGYEANADFNAADNLSEAGLEQARKEKLLSTDGRTVAARGGDVAGAPEETRTTVAKAWRKTPPKTVAANT